MAKEEMKPTADTSFIPMRPLTFWMGFDRSLDMTYMKGNAPVMTMLALRQIRAPSSSVSRPPTTSKPVRKRMMPRARPRIMQTLMMYPKTLKILTQAEGKRIRPKAMTAEKITSGSRFSSRAMIGTRQISPAAKHPTGIVAMPQSIPKRSSRWSSFSTIPSATGMEKEMVHPIMEDTTRALYRPISGFFATSTAREAPPMSLANSDAGRMEASICRTLDTKSNTGRSTSAIRGAMTIIPIMDRAMLPNR